MKKIALLFLLVFAGCSGVEVIRDEYRNTTVVQLTLENDSGNFLFPGHSQSILFKRLVDSSKRESLSARMLVSLKRLDEPLTEKLFFKIDGRLFELNLENLETSSKTLTRSNENKTTGKTEFYSYTVPMGVGTVTFSPEVRDALMRCSNFQVRVYLGDRPVTFDYSGRDVAELKYFLNYEVE